MSNLAPEVTKFIEAVCGQGNGCLSISYTTDPHLKSLRSDFIDVSKALVKGRNYLFRDHHNFD
jgi:hypothetical protein